MINLKRSYVFIVLLVSALSGYSGDSLQTNSFNSQRIFDVENLWLKTGNVSGLFFNHDNELILFDAGANMRNGDFHRVSEDGDISRYSFNTSSYQSIGEKIFASGKFEYNNMDADGARWSGTYDPYRGNPYLLADSLSGTSWHKENYRLGGQMAYVLSDKLILGCGVEYFAAVAAKQKDPRPENTITSFAIHPSLIIKKNNYNLGVDIGYKNRKEQIDYYTYRSNFNSTFFMFKGFGFYSKEIDTGFNRFQTASEMTGGIQFEKEFSGMQNLTELRFNYSFEGIEDGSSTIIKEDGGNWATYEIVLNEQLKKVTGKNTHLFEANLSFFNGDGTELTQDKVNEGDHVEYVTIAENLKFNRQIISGELAYSYLRMKENKKIDWDIKATVDAINKAEEYYFIPEVFSSSYMNVSGMAEIQKNFYFGRIHFAPTLSASYTSNISNSLLLSNLAEITKNQRPEIYIQDFEYYSADLLKMGGKIQLGYCPQDIKSIDQINFSLMVDYWKPIELETNTTFISAKIGFVF